MEHVLAEGDPEGRVEEATKKLIDRQDVELLTVRRKNRGSIRPHIQSQAEEAKRYKEICEHKMEAELHKPMEAAQYAEQELSMKMLKLQKESSAILEAQERGGFSKQFHQAMMQVFNGDVAEGDSPPRVINFAKYCNLEPGWSLDLTTQDDGGKAWDFPSEDPIINAKQNY